MVKTIAVFVLLAVAIIGITGGEDNIMESRREELAQLALRTRQAGDDPTEVLAAAVQVSPGSSGGLGAGGAHREAEMAIHTKATQVCNFIRGAVLTSVSGHYDSLIAGGMSAKEAQAEIEKKLDAYLPQVVSMTFDKLGKGI